MIVDLVRERAPAHASKRAATAGRSAVRVVVASAVMMFAASGATALADVPLEAPVLLPRDPETSKIPVHGTPSGRVATGRITDVEVTDAGSRITVALDTPVGSITRVTDKIPSAQYGETTKWTDRFDAVQVNDAVTARVSLAGGKPALTSLSSQASEDRRARRRQGARWTNYGLAFRPSRLPQAWDLQADLPQFAHDGVMTGVGWWQADRFSFWQLNAPGPMHSSPSLGDCAQGVPSRSWLRFGEVREAFDGAIGVATYCSDASGRSAFEVILDYRVDYDLDVVAGHELGHGLGLGHSDDLGAVMYPMAYPKDALGADDLNGLRSLYPGQIAAYAALPDGFVAPPGGDPRVRRALIWVVPVGESDITCDRGSVRVRINPPAARASFHGDGYDPATGIATPAENPFGESVCQFHVEARPRSNYDAGPGEVTFTPMYPGATVQQAATANVRLPRLTPPPSSDAGLQTGSDGPGQTPLRISVPLRIRGAKITRGWRLRFKASLTSRADFHKIRVTVQARGRKRTYNHVIHGGRIKFDRRMAGSQIGARRVTVRLRFGGSPEVAPASASITFSRGRP